MKSRLHKLSELYIKCSEHLKLEDFCKIKTDLYDADFWIIRKGTEDKVGMPTKEYNKEYIGIKVKEDAQLLPTYLYYLMTYIHSIGYFKNLAKGTLKLVHITTEDVKSIKLKSQ